MRRSGRSRPVFALLCAAVLVETAGLGALFPLLARIQAADHLPTSALGVMSAAAFFAALAAQLGLARLLDGPRSREVLLAALLASSAAQIWFGLGSTLWELAAARAIGGLGYGVIMPAALRAGAAGMDPEQRGTRLGRLASLQMVGIVIGPLVGAGLYGLGGLEVPFVTIGGVGLVVAALLWVAGTEVPAPAEDKTTQRPGRPRIWARPVLAVLLLGVAMQLPNGLYDALWSRLLTDRGAATSLIGISLAVFGVPYALLAPLGGRLSRRRPLLWASTALLVAICFLFAYGLVASAVVITVLGVFEACAQAVAVPGGYAAAAVAFPEEWASTGQGWYSAAGTAAAGLASLGGAPLYAAAGPGVVFAVGAVVSAAFVLAGLAVGGAEVATGAAVPV